MCLHLFCCASSVMSCIYPPTHSHLSPYPVVLPVCHAPRSIVDSPAPVAYSNPLSVFLGSGRLAHYPLSHPSAALSNPGHPRFSFLAPTQRHAFAACSPSITSSSPILDLRNLEHFTTFLMSFFCLVALYFL